jgi:hypothetical protein
MYDIVLYYVLYVLYGFIVFMYCMYYMSGVYMLYVFCIVCMYCMYVSFFFKFESGLLLLYNTQLCMCQERRGLSMPHQSIISLSLSQEVYIRSHQK